MSPTTINISLEQTSTKQAVVFGRGDANAYSSEAGSRHRVPYFMPLNQAYYWSAVWQTGEAEALREIGEGQTERFASGADAAAWLLSDD